MWNQAKQIVFRILHADDGPHRIAWGVAVGMFVAWTPTIGAQMVIAAALAWLLRGNVAAAAAVVWVTNPYTMVPVYWFNYVIGTMLVGGPPLNLAWFEDLIHNDSHRAWLDYMAFAYQKLAEVFWPMWVGSVAAAIPIAAASYAATYYAIRRHRQARIPALADVSPTAPAPDISYGIPAKSENLAARPEREPNRHQIATVAKPPSTT